MVCEWSLPAAQAPQPVAHPEFVPLVVTVKTPKPATRSSYDVAASATSNLPDPTAADASATGVVPMTPVDLAVSKAVGSPVLAGDDGRRGR